MATIHANWARNRLWVWRDEAAASPKPLPFGEASLLLSRTMNLAEKGGNALSSSLVAAPDLLFLASLWRLVLQTVAAQRILPALEPGRSRWTPMLCDAERSRLETLCASAPEGLQAIPGAVPPQTFFREAVDMLARTSCATARELLFDRVSPDNLHSLFLASLAGTDAKIAWNDTRDLDTLSAMLAEWRGRAMPGAGDHPPIGFRIADPVNSDSLSPLWRLVPVVVSDKTATPVTAKTLEAMGPAAAIGILKTLGLVSSFVRELEDAGSGAAGRAIAATLDAASLRAFMEDTVPILEAAGFPVFAPRWWKPKNARRPTIRAVSAEFARKEGAFSLDSIVNVKWQVVLDGTGITERELKWIAENEIPVAKIGGRWMNIDTEQIKDAAKAIENLSARTSSLRDLVRVAFFQDGVPTEIPDSALPQEALKLARPFGRKGKLEKVKVPKDFKGTLRPYQKTGLDWLSYLRKAGFGACLADDMGLGKTVEALVAFLDARRDGEKGPILLVCPMSIMLKWFHETKRFAPSLSPWIYHGPDRPRGEAFRAEALSRGLCITSYQMLGAEMESFSSVHWAIAALDEAQNVKNPSTVKSRSARSLDATWRLAITGTPVENQTTDLWAIMDFANRGLLPPRADFERRFGSNSSEGGNDAAAALRKLVGPFILRRTKADPAIAAGLPPKVEEKVFCRLTAEQAALYAAETGAAEKDVAAKTGIARRGAVLALITRLKEICDYPPIEGNSEKAAAVSLDPERSGKLATLDEMLGQVLAAGEAALVFTQYASFGRLLARHLSERFGFEVPFLHGGVSSADREEMVRRFQDESGPQIFLISIRAGGLGFNLTRANHVFHYDRWWNPATENQATDRAHRIGQSKTVFVHTFICDGTLESKIDTLISGKQRLADQVVATGSGWLANLDDATLMEIISLSDASK